MTNWQLPVKAITDGTQVVKHTAYEVDQINTALRQSPEMQRLFDKARDEFFTGPALLRDMFTVLANRTHSASPYKMQTPYRVNQNIIQRFITSASFEELHEMTANNRRYTQMALHSVSKGILSNLSEEAKTIAEKIQQIEQKKQQLAEQRKKQQQQADQAQQTQAAAAQAQQQAQAAQQQADPQAQQQTQAAAAQAQQQAQAAQQQVDQTQAEELTLEQQLDAEIAALDAALQQQQDQLQNAINHGTAEAEEEIEGMETALKVFGYNAGGDSQGKNVAEDIETIAEALKRNPQLKDIVRIAGRLIRIATAVQMSKTTETREEIVGITLGRDIELATSEWLALLNNPVLNVLALNDIANNQIPQLEMEGRTPQAEGPIEIIVDGSGSMDSDLAQGVTRHGWARAVTLAILQIARKTNRDVTVVDFGGSDSELRTWEFPKGQNTLEYTINMLNFTFGSGTAFEPWMHQTMQRIKTDPRSKADVIVISDGDVRINSATVTAFNELREEKGMKCFSIQIGYADKRAIHMLEAISDEVFALDDLKADENAILETVFRI